MKLAASNIAWAPEDRRAAYGLLRRHGVRGLEIAPGLLFDGEADPLDPPEHRVKAVCAELEDAGLSLVSMQSLLFGTQGAALFGTRDERAALQHRIGWAIHLAGRLGIPNLVFGSPGYRVIPATMDRDRAWHQAAEIFRCLGDEAAAAQTVFSIEAVAPAHGTNFLNTTEEALAFVELAAHPAVTLTFDTGALYSAGAREAPESLVSGVPVSGTLMSGALPLTSHVHLSEPDLAPAPADTEQAATILSTLNRSDYDGWVSLEMRAVQGRALGSLEEALGRFSAAVQRVQALAR